MDTIRALDPAGGRNLTEQQVADAYPWPDTDRWVRAMMVTTLDGAAAGPDGLSGTVSSDTDQVVFSATRRYADAVLIGSGTMRAEQYTPMRATDDDARRRTEAGQAPAPVIAVASRSLDLPWELPVWRESAQRPIVIAPESADAGRLGRAREHAEVVTVPDTTPHAIVAALVDRGLRRIVCEGGPRLLRDLVAADLVDEADITLAPYFAGTATSPTTSALPDVTQYRLAHVLEGENTLMMRYLARGR